MCKVSSTCLVILERNRYSAPCELVGQIVRIRVYPEQIDLVAHNALVASHRRSFAHKETLYDWQHYIPLIQRKPGALPHHCHIVEMGNESYRFRHSTATAKSRIKAREQSKKGAPPDEIEPF